MDELKDLGFLPCPKGFATTSNHAGQDPDNWDSLCVMPPIVMSTTYKHLSTTEFKKYQYGRYGNPTRDCLETLLAAIEDAKYGLCFSSGLGAATSLLNMFQTGDHFILSEELYGGLNRLFKHMGNNFAIELTFTDCTDIKKVRAAIKPNTKLIFIETPTNPGVKVIDIKELAQLTKKHGIILGVDNTFLTAYLQRPMELGADFSLYSCTKYLNGHTDVIMGAIVTNNTEIYEKLKYIQSSLGIVPSPFDCYQVIRGIKTLEIRLKRQCSSSYKIAKFLENHPKIERVCHPCLKSSPSFEIAKKQSSGHSGLFAFYIKGDRTTCDKFFSGLKVFTLAGSLGGTESLIAYPTTMTHFQYSNEEKKLLKINDNLIRVSVGIEDPEDLIEDLRQALDKF